MFNKRMLYIVLSTVLAVSLCLNIYFVYQLCTAEQLPPVNFHGIL